MAELAVYRVTLGPQKKIFAKQSARVLWATFRKLGLTWSYRRKEVHLNGNEK